MKQYLSAFAAGLLFAVGLAISGMTQPAKVVGFLDIAGSWDPSLAFVMGGAILAYLPLYRLITKRQTPLFSGRFLIPTRNDIDGRLIGGAVLFGVGWGLGGFCPGPVLTASGAGAPQALIVAAAMFAGFGLHSAFEMLRDRRAARAAEAKPS